MRRKRGSALPMTNTRAANAVYSLVVGLSLIADFGWESIFVSLVGVPLARLRALSGVRGGAFGKLEALTSTTTQEAQTITVERIADRRLAVHNSRSSNQHR